MHVVFLQLQHWGQLLPLLLLPPLLPVLLLLVVCSPPGSFLAPLAAAWPLRESANQRT
jgi:hypothetical protein